MGKSLETREYLWNDFLSNFRNFAQYTGVMKSSIKVGPIFLNFLPFFVIKVPFQKISRGGFVFKKKITWSQHQGSVQKVALFLKGILPPRFTVQNFQLIYKAVPKIFTGF